mmetsp:Transcript_5874/g.9022  ORF Transcript_5874/g.9022 Transcript_5874/m.9022 type:complete len:140 (-) Transcript_5874:256-675(-)
MADNNPVQMTQQQLNQLIAAAAAAAPAPPIQPPAGAFAITPSLVSTTPIDYSTKAGAAIYEKATQKLEHKFSLAEPNITALITQLKAKATSHGWQTLLTVTDSDGNNNNFLEKYSKISKEEVKAHADALMIVNDRTKTE